MIEGLRNWRLEATRDGVSELVLDKADSSVNVLDSATFDELERVLEYLEQNPPQALVIRSGKEAGFLAGADVTEFQKLSGRDEILAKVRRGQDLFMRLRRLSFRTVAAIHGHCVGGGLELALACDYRIVDEAEASLGLPEVKLGIHPGYGGTVRLTGLINPLQALNLMLEGRTVDGRTARRLGLADEVVPQRHLLEAAHQVATGRHQPLRRRGALARVLDLSVARRIAAWFVERKLAAKANPDHYPAPFQLLRLWSVLPRDSSAAMLAEADSFADLLDNPAAMRTMQNLVRVFLLDREIRGRARKKAFTGDRVHVVGAGVMGGDIAAWAALRGFTVTLQDAAIEQIGPAIKRAAALFQRRLKRPHLVTAAMDRLVPDPGAHGVTSADLVIEAITEKLEAKRGLYSALEPRMPDRALLASNTSSLPMEQLADGLKQPQRLVGIHFFNPVARMQLVEVVRGDNSSTESVERAMGFVSRLGKLAVEVDSQPGFLVNRVLMAYLSEALRLHEEGVPSEQIDYAAEQFGMPMGPIELADTVGLDICRAVAGELNRAFGGSDSAELAQLVESGRLGRKSGEGFYTWNNGKAVKRRNVERVDPVLQDRMVYALLNEAVQALADGVVADEQTLDIAMIFGTGFPPFLGGPVHYARALGIEACVARLEQLATEVDVRFSPKPGWSGLSDSLSPA